jgi:hypothetical protein
MIGFDMDHQAGHSGEFEIDLSIEDLVGKLISDSLTAQDEARFNQLLAQRSRMMRPNVKGRSRRNLAA